MKLKHLLLIFAVSLLALGCSSGNDEILSTIPAEGYVIVKADIETLNKQIGENILANMGTPGLREDLEKCLDLKNFFMIVRENGNTVFTVSVKDAKELDRILDKQLGGGHHEGEYLLYGDGTALRNDNQLWLVSVSGSREPLEVVKGLLNEASKSSAADVKQMRETLSGDDLLAVVAPIAGVEDASKGGTALMCLTAEIKGKEIEFETETAFPDGTDYDIPGMCKLSTDVLSYAPANPWILFAYGINKDFDWEKSLAPFKKLLPMQQAGMLSLLQPYLEAVDGTVMMAASPRGTLLDVMAAGDLSAVDFIVMAQMAPDKAQQTVKDLLQLAQENNLECSQAGIDLYSANIGTKVYFGVVDGCLTVASYKPVKDTYTKGGIFKDADGIMIFEMPAQEWINPKFNFGIRFVYDIKGHEGEGLLTTPGSDKPVLQALFGLAND